MNLYGRLLEVHDLCLQGKVTATLKKEAGNGLFKIPAGSRVAIWTVSRFGWAGVTDQGQGPTCYTHCVGGPEKELRNPGPLEEWLGDVIVHNGGSDDPEVG